MEWKENLGVGPESEDRESRVTPELVQLSEGQPLYHAFLRDPDAITVSTDEVHSAKSRLYQIIATNPEAVVSCNGKTIDEARAILESIEFSENEKAA
ncbi:MAG: hypothetical protein EXS47_01965 [Candidatus Zambryskibacteria bacterium]|nr:hypothetical protein [Candidatus Zambryskibacteria bacterium]